MPAEINSIEKHVEKFTCRFRGWNEPGRENLSFNGVIFNEICEPAVLFRTKCLRGPNPALMRVKNLIKLACVALSSGSIFFVVDHYYHLSDRIMEAKDACDVSLLRARIKPGLMMGLTVRFSAIFSGST